MALFAAHNEQEFKVGDTVRVHQRIQEDEKTRTQVFEGIVISIRGESVNRTFTVRRLGAGGIGIERIFPLNSPFIEKVDVVARGEVRRAKLYYLREKPSREIAEIAKRRTRKEQAKKQSAAKKKTAPRKKKS